MKTLKFFVDFDGTITQNDVIDMILEKFAGPEWKKIEEKWAKNEIGSRECLSSQLSLVKMNASQYESLISEIKVDPYFKEFVSLCKKLAIPVIIVSDGLDQIIKSTLEKLLGKEFNLPVYSNRLVWTDTGIKIDFPNGPACEHGCATCKERIIKKLKDENDTVLFIGDGLSDRFAARVSDLVFAKNKLIKFCEEENLPFRKYAQFDAINEWLKEYEMSQEKVFNLKQSSVIKN